MTFFICFIKLNLWSRPTSAFFLTTFHNSAQSSVKIKNHLFGRASKFTPFSQNMIIVQLGLASNVKVTFKPKLGFSHKKYSNKLKSNYKIWAVKFAGLNFNSMEHF